MTPEQRTELIKAAFLDGLTEIVEGKRQMMKEAKGSLLSRAGQWLGIGGHLGTPAGRAMSGVGSLRRFLAPAAGAYGMGALGSGSLNPLNVMPWMVQHPIMTAGGAIGGHALGGIGRGVAGLRPGAPQTYESTMQRMLTDAQTRFPNLTSKQHVAMAQEGAQALAADPAMAQAMLRAGAPRMGLGAMVALPAAGLGGMALLGKGREAIMGDQGGGGGLFGGGGGGGLGMIPNMALSGLGGYAGYQAGQAMDLPWYGKWGLGALGATMTPQLVGSMVGGPGGGAAPTGYGY